MQWLVIVPGYFLWHYTAAFKQSARIWITFLWFVYRLFSIPQLLRTIFAPWKRMVETGEGGFDLERWAETVLVNLVSRLVGALIRIPIILLGCFALLSTICFWLLFSLFWIVAPAVVVILFMSGVTLILL